MMNHITVKFVATDDDRFKEFQQKVVESLGNEKFVDGVYVGMVSKTCLSSQIDDINDILTSDDDDEDKLIAIDAVLSRF